MAAPSTAMCTSFKVELMTGLHNFTNTTGNTFKAALFKAAASVAGTYGAATTNYSQLTTDELANGSGYTTGGNTLTNVTPTSSSTTALTDFQDTSWSSATFTTSGMLIYNTSSSNRAVSTHAFGGDQTVSSGTFTVVFPTADASNAILRLT